MKSYTNLAKELVAKVYGQYPRFSDIRAREIHTEEYSIHYGAFRSVLVSEDYNFVVKTSWDREGIRQCKEEMQVYARAVADGVNNYFAKCYGCFEMGELVFFVFEQVPYIEQVEEFIPWDRELDKEFFHTSLFRTSAFLKTRKTALKLLAFLEENGVGDLHDGNFGYSESKGHIVITDYAPWD